MSSYRQILYHLIFRTKDSRKTLVLDKSDELYSYIGGIIKNKNCFIYEINGMEDHIHILSDLHPSIALADYIRDIKTSSSLWLKKHPDFQKFRGWSDGYAALTYSYREIKVIQNYIKKQREHHKKVDFIDEYRKLLKEQNIEIDEKYFP